MIRIIQTSKQSGDRYHIPGALVVGGASIDVMVLYESGNPSSRVEAQSMLEYYRGWGFQNVNLSAFEGDLAKHMTRITDSFNKLLPVSTLKRKGQLESRLNELLADGTWNECTAYVAPVLNSLHVGEIRRELRKRLSDLFRLEESSLSFVDLATRAWRGHDLDVGCVAELMKGNDDERSRALFDAPSAVCLWGRRSGKDQELGPHPEHTSSSVGWEQLTRAFFSLYGPNYPALVLLGDPLKEGERGTQAKRLWDKGYDGLLSATDLTRVWDESQYNKGYEKLFGTVNRTLVQLAIFLASDLRRGGRMVHVGMRSGMLISLAYLGLRVVYVEEADCPSRAKWENFQGTMSNLVRCCVTWLPTGTGRRLQEIGKKIRLRDGRSALRDSRKVYKIEREAWDIIKGGGGGVLSYLQNARDETHYLQQAFPGDAINDYAGELHAVVAASDRLEPKGVGFEADDLGRLFDLVRTWLDDPTANQSDRWDLWPPDGTARYANRATIARSYDRTRAPRWTPLLAVEWAVGQRVNYDGELWFVEAVDTVEGLGFRYKLKKLSATVSAAALIRALRSDSGTRRGPATPPLRGLSFSGARGGSRRGRRRAR